MAVPDKLPHKDVSRGDASMKSIKDLSQPTIVKTYQFGNSKVHIASDFIRTDPDEIEKVLDDYHAAGWSIAQECWERGEKV